MHMVLFLEASDSPVAAAGGRDSIGRSLGVLRDAAAALCTPPCLSGAVVLAAG